LQRANIKYVGINLIFRESSVVSLPRDILTPKTSRGYVYPSSGVYPGGERLTDAQDPEMNKPGVKGIHSRKKKTAVSIS